MSDSERKVARRFFCRFGAGLGLALVRALSLHACARGGRAKLSVDASWFLGGGCAVFSMAFGPCSCKSLPTVESLCYGPWHIVEFASVRTPLAAGANGPTH